MADFFWGDFFSTNEKVVQEAYSKTKTLPLKTLKTVSENLGLTTTGRTKEPYIKSILEEMSKWIKEVNSADPKIVMDYKLSVVDNLKQGTKPIPVANFTSVVQVVSTQVQDDEILREEILKWILSTLESGKKTIKKKEFEEYMKKTHPNIAAKTDVQEQLTIVSKKYTSIPSSKRIEALKQELNKHVSIESQIVQRLKNEYNITANDSDAIETIFKKLKEVSENEKNLINKLKLLQEQSLAVKEQTKETLSELSEDITNLDVQGVKDSSKQLANLNSDAKSTYNNTYLVASELIENTENPTVKSVGKQLIKNTEHISNVINNIDIESKNLARNLENYNTSNKKLKQEFSLQKISNNIENISSSSEMLDDFSLDDLDFDFSETSNCNPNDIDKSINESQIAEAIDCNDMSCNVDTGACETSKDEDESVRLNSKDYKLTGSKKSDILIKIKKLIQRYKISNERQKIFNSQPIDVSGLARIQQDMGTQIDSAQYKLQFSREEAREAFKRALLE